MDKWTRRAFVTTGVLAGGALVVGVAVRPGNRSKKVANLIAGEGESVIGVWLKLAPDNTVTAIVPHAEMGQGTHTTLAMMLADEMDADWSLVRMTEAPAHKEYANHVLAKGYALGDTRLPEFLVPTIDGLFLKVTQAMSLQITAGSLSTRMTGQFGMRVAGAAARTMLLEAAAAEWNVPVEELHANRSLISHSASNRSAPYAKFATRAAQLSEPVQPSLKSQDQFTIMGTSPARFDVPAKVDGSAAFGIDARLPGMKYAAIKAAPVFGSAVESFDDNAIRRLPGVRDVINLGNAVAVVADGYWQASQALNKLHIGFTATDNDDRDQGDIFRQFRSAMETATSDNDEIVDFEKGDAKLALADAGRVIEAEYRVPYLAHAPLEPMNCTARVQDGRCEIWLGTQNPLGFAAEVADAIDMDAEDVQVHNQYLGGGFGRRAFPDYAIQAGRIAANVDYPVQLIWSREEDMRHDHYRQAAISRFTAALDANGNPLAWLNQYVEKHDPEEAPHIPYGIDNQYIHFVDSPTHVPWGIWRSVDHSLHAFFTESFIDELAVAAGKDPFRYRHDLLEDSPRFQKVLEIAAEKAGWGNPLPENRGRGIAIHKSFGTIVAQVAEVEIIEGKVRAHRVICAVDAGFAVHPDGLKAQMESGIVFGLTAALYGDISIRRGAVAQSNFHDYQMLRMNEAPQVETYIVNGANRPGGGGEPGTPAIAPAVANAIFDASGVRIRELPIKHYDLRRGELESKDVA